MAETIRKIDVFDKINQLIELEKLASTTEIRIAELRNQIHIMLHEGFPT